MPPLITAEQHARLLANGLELERDPLFDPVPVARLIARDTSASWLLCAAYPAVPTVALALCSMGLRPSWLAPVSIPVLTAEAERLGLRIESDPGFEPEGPVSGYGVRTRPCYSASISETRSAAQWATP